MSGSSASGFTWKEVANILCVSSRLQQRQFSSVEIKPQKKVRIRDLTCPGWHKRCAAHFQSGAAPPSR